MMLSDRTYGSLTPIGERQQISTAVASFCNFSKKCRRNHNLTKTKCYIAWADNNRLA